MIVCCSMNVYLLDTNVVSHFYNSQRKSHAAVRSRIASLGTDTAHLISVIVVAELRYGMKLAELSGDSVDTIRDMVHQCERHPLAEVTRHTAAAYGDLKARIAHVHVKIGSRRPRWPEDWVNRVTGKALQVDENDLWLMAQAIERDLILVTCDRRAISRVAAFIPELKTLDIRPDSCVSD